MLRSPKFYLPVILVLALAAGLAAQQVCQVGNLEDPVPPVVPDLITGGDQVFAYLIHPVEQCGCSEGFVQFQEVRMWLQFEPWMIPQNFIVRAGLRPAIWNPNVDRWEPDGYFYESFDIPVEVFDPGPFVLSIPTEHARWINIDDFFFLTVTFLSPLEANLVGDGMDLPGITYMSPDGGNHWMDLWVPDKTSGGKPIIWGDVLCGAFDTTDSPVPGSGAQLETPYPNPFNPSTTIALTLEQEGPVTLTVHDSRGHLVRELADETRPVGTWRYVWDGRDNSGRAVPAGTYFFRARTRTEVLQRKAVLIK